MDKTASKTPARRTVRDKAIDTAMRAMYGTWGPPDDVDVDAIRRILGTVFDAGTTARNTR